MAISSFEAVENLIPNENKALDNAEAQEIFRMHSLLIMKSKISKRESEKMEHRKRPKKLEGIIRVSCILPNMK